MKNIVLLGVVCCLLAACNKPAEVAPKAAVSTTPGPAPSAYPNAAAVPDVGKIEHVAVSATGSAIAPGAAMNEALKNAIMQVNGTSIDAVSGNLNLYTNVTATLDVESDYRHASAQGTLVAQGSHFAEAIVSSSQGTISSFKVVKMTAPDKKGAVYTTEIEAKVAKFKPPADSGKIKIVVAPLRSNKTAFNIGGRKVPATEVLSGLRQRIIDALSQTGRFTVLDRDFENELQGELAMMESGTIVNTDFAKMGQALSADLVWVGMVNDFAFDKHVRQLRTSDRELVSYSGGWSVSQRMINLATRQILQSETLQGTVPSIAPTTLSRGIDAGGTLKRMQAEIVKRSAEAILLQTFPISVVERDGMNVILSQGGSSLAEKGRYKVYLQGKEIKDPQTGLSLGKTESVCCEVLITRVTPKLSYGTLENVTVKLDGIQAGALQLRDAMSAKAAAPNSDAKAAAPVVASGKPPLRKVAAKRSAEEKPAESPDW
jgi:curli biogenesis system outer membrane secretion channel CsgG